MISTSGTYFTASRAKRRSSVAVIEKLPAGKHADAGLERSGLDLRIILAGHARRADDDMAPRRNGCQHIVLHAVGLGIVDQDIRRHGERLRHGRKNRFAIGWLPGRLAEIAACCLARDTRNKLKVGRGVRLQRQAPCRPSRCSRQA